MVDVEAVSPSPEDDSSSGSLIHPTVHFWAAGFCRVNVRVRGISVEAVLCFRGDGDLLWACDIGCEFERELRLPELVGGRDVSGRGTEIELIQCVCVFQKALVDQKSLLIRFERKPMFRLMS